MTIGFRPKGEAGPAYHPDRDYAYITPTLMKSAVERLDNNALSEEAAQWKNENNISEAEIVAVVEALARAQRDFINAADPVASFEQALARRDFLDIRYPVRQFLFSAVGEVCCAAWFKAVREVSKVGESSPVEPAMADFMAAVRAFVRKPGCPNLEGATTVPQLQLRVDVLQARNNALYVQLQQLMQTIAQKELADTANKLPKTIPRLTWFNVFIRLFTRK
jgi:hypothetical protein